MNTKSLLALLLIPFGTLFAADAKLTPKQDVVEVPAIRDGLCVSNAFQSHMVLQRDKPLEIWGWAAAGEMVAVSFAGQKVSATAAADRSWRVSLTAIPANTTPQTMTIAGKSATLTLEDILVGDVWVLGGQSNMEFPIERVDDGALEIASANFPQIRLLTMPQGKGFDSVASFERLHEWSDFFGQHYRKGDWEVCSPETVKEFSGIGYVFGRRLFMATQVPIGLIDASIGGTTVETWTPADVLQKVEGVETKELLKEWSEKITAYDAQKDLESRIQRHNESEKKKPTGKPAPTNLRPGPVADMNRPGRCYASVIRPLTGFAVKGAVWHQGFNNCFDGTRGARMYYQVFSKMITAWRTAFDAPEMPFCILSLCTADTPQTRENFLKPMHDAGAFIREAQYRTFLDFRAAGDKNIGFGSTFDLRKSWYHPQIKIPAGERAAKWALATQYRAFKGNDADDFWLPPTIKEMKAEGNTFRLTMSTEVTMKDDHDPEMTGFAIAGNDRRFFPAEVRYLSEPGKDNAPKTNRRVLMLSSPFVPQPAHYRYAWARNPMANIANNRQVILPAQRSDDWPLEETPLKFPDATAAKQGANLTRKELELADTERQIQEAEATISRLREKYEKDRKAFEESKRAKGVTAYPLTAGGQ